MQERHRVFVREALSRTPATGFDRSPTTSQSPRLPVSAPCDFGIADVLEVCHLDRQRSNTEVGKLVILCAKPRARSSMEVACHCAQVDSRWPLGGEASRIPQSQLVAAQQTNRCTRAGTAPANS